jgi:DNA polymerase IV (DinB-like DNA polymerase)
MLVDMDCFFAQTEGTRDPSLKDKPVVVCVYSGRTEDSGAVSTANYAARKYGVKSGMPISLAKRKLEGMEAMFLPVDHVFYDEISGKVMNLLRRYADSFEQVSVDEAFLDVTKRTAGSYDNARELAQKMKDELKAQLRLTGSIGVGPNKVVAKIAADAHKPDGLTIVRTEQVEAFLFPLPVGRLIGVGAKTRDRMSALGISTIGELARYDLQKLIAAFGKTLGIYYHNASIGLDDQPVQDKDEAESVSRISTLKQNTRDLVLILGRTDQLCDEIHAEILQQKLAFKTVGIIAVMVDMSIHSRSKTLESPTDEKELLKITVRELLKKLLNETEIEVRRVGVKVSAFVRGKDKQKQLTSFFSSSEKEYRDLKKKGEAP